MKFFYYCKITILAERSTNYSPNTNEYEGLSTRDIIKKKNSDFEDSEKYISNSNIPKKQKY